jgi:hypothetical protein
MKVYQSADLPLRTHNVALAFALYIAGIPFADEKKPLVNIYDADILRGLGYEGNIEASACQARIDGKRGAVEYGFAKNYDLGPVMQAFDRYKPVDPERDCAPVLFSELCQHLSNGELSLTMALAAGSRIVLRRWRAELDEWATNPVYSARHRKNEAGKDDARRVCEQAFATGDFYEFAACIMDARAAFLDLWKGCPPTIRLRRGDAPSYRDAEIVNPRTGKPVAGKIGKYPGFIAFSTDTGNEIRRHLGAPEL